ncbi:MAG TPA: hypothetical protein VF952_09095 [Chloroflexia bacterium]|jgi:hypothetical protein
MRVRDIEIWTFQVIGRLKRNQQIEDSRVELKAAWPDNPASAARRIAGHANAARGEDILWLIGVDEARRVVVGASPTDLATWYPQVRSHFDGVAPDLTDVAVDVDGLTVMALRFATDQAPYIVKHSQAQVTREVPWRDGTRIRSASRSELLLTMADVVRLPDFRLLKAQFQVRPQGNDGKGHTGSVSLHLYVQPRTQGRVVLPVYARRLTFKLPIEAAAPIPCRVWLISTEPPDSNPFEANQQARLAAATIHVREHDILVNGPGSLYVVGDFERVLLPDGYENLAVELQLTISDTSFPRPIVIQAQVVPGASKPQGTTKVAYWSLPASQLAE